MDEHYEWLDRPSSLAAAAAADDAAAAVVVVVVLDEEDDGDAAVVVAFADAVDVDEDAAAAAQMLAFVHSSFHVVTMFANNMIPLENDIVTYLQTKSVVDDDNFHQFD